MGLQLRRGHGATEQAHFMQGTAQTEMLIVVLKRPNDHGAGRGIQNGTRLITTGGHHRAVDQQTHLGPVIHSGHVIPPVGLERSRSSQEGESLPPFRGQSEREAGFDESQHPTALEIAIVLHLADEPAPRGDAVHADPGFGRHIALGQQRPIRRIGHHDALVAARKLDPWRTGILHQSGFAHEGQLLADGRSHTRVLCPLRGEDPAPDAAGFLGTQTQCGGKKNGDSEANQRSGIHGREEVETLEDVDGSEALGERRHNTAPRSVLTKTASSAAASP